MSAYSEAIHRAMLDLSKDPKRLFVGYSTKIGRFAGSLSGVREEQLIETPTAENMMAGLATGLSISGWKPVLCFQRFDFVLNALDAIVNHLDKLPRISDREFCPKVLIRIVVGNRRKPLYTGETHTSDYCEALQEMVTFPIIPAITPDRILEAYAKHSESTAAIIEYKDLY